MELQGKKVAILVEQQYEDLELWYPFYRLKEAGAEVVLIGVEAGHRYESKHGYPAKADEAVADVAAAEFDALVIPGGYSPDHMRRHPEMVEFTRAMGEAGKPVAAICHGGWMLVSAGLLEGGRDVTSFHSIKDDMINAGGNWIDQEVVRDRNLITSRSPDDLPAFCRALIEALGAAAQAGVRVDTRRPSHGVRSQPH